MSGNKPLEKLSDGPVKASIFVNNGANGTWFEASIQRVYKKGDEYKYSNSYSLDQLKKLRNVTDQAIAFIEGAEADETPMAAE